MPMYQKITHEESVDYCKIVKKEENLRSLNPGKTTLALIMQFACSYHVEKSLPASLSEMMLN
jgi:hypothetical protein